MNFKNLTLREIENKINSIEFINNFYRLTLLFLVILSFFKLIIEEITIMDSLIIVILFMILILPQFLKRIEEKETKRNELKKLKKIYIHQNT